MIWDMNNLIMHYKPAKTSIMRNVQADVGMIRYSDFK